MKKKIFMRAAVQILCVLLLMPDIWNIAVASAKETVAESQSQTESQTETDTESGTESAADADADTKSGITIGTRIVMDTKEDVDAYIGSMSDEWPAMPDVDCECAVAIELNSGTILYAKNATQTHYPASVTKIMTGLLTVENCSMSEEVTFSKEAIHSLPSGASNIALNTGEILSVENCMYALLIPSANEVANGLAEHIAGSVSEFALLMNARADQIGCVNTNFVNANGLHDENHYSCAYDLALIFGECVQNSTFLRLDSTPTYVIPPTNLQPEERPIGSTDAMMRKTTEYYDPDIISGKTGWTAEAGRNLVSYVEHDGMDIIICVLGAEETPLQYEATTAIKNYCFENFKLVNIAANDTKFSVLNNSSTKSPINIPVKELTLFSLDTEDCAVLPVGTEFEALDVEIVYTASGDDFAEINYLYDGYPVGRGHLLMTSDELRKQEFAGITQDELTIDPIDFDSYDTEKKLPVRYIAMGFIIVALVVVCVSFIRNSFKGQEKGHKKRTGKKSRRKSTGPDFESLSRKRKR